ncbi:MAG: LuxR C-terminal-related transcriptional regulator [Phyllobacterium sp.]
MLNKQIAHELNVSKATIKAHVSAVLYASVQVDLHVNGIAT